MSHSHPDLTDTSALRELAQAGAERARSALATLLSREVYVTDTYATVLREPIEQLAERASATDGADRTTLGRLGIHGPPDGAAWISFPNACVERMLEAFDLAEAGPTSPEGRSMIAEVANIVTGSYLTELGDTWGVHLSPTPTNLDAGAAAILADLERAGASDSAHAMTIGCGFSGGSQSPGWDMAVYLLLAQDGATDGSDH